MVLTATLLVIAVFAHGVLAEQPRWDTALEGGRLLPVADWATTWADYLASWHAMWGGTGAAAPISLLVLGLAGTVLGGPATVVAGLLLFGIPLAGLSAYAAGRASSATRVWRAVVAGAYAVFPAVAVSAGQGRVDVVVTHVLVPPLLAGLAVVIGLVPARRQWFSTACQTALGLAVLGAFAPLMQLALLALAMLGFVSLPAARASRTPSTSPTTPASTSDRPGGRGRVAGLVVVVLLSLGCLLPWLATLRRHPEILLHGLGARGAEPEPGAWLLLLSPDGSALTWFGVLLPIAGLAALVLARACRVLPAVVVLGSGWVLAAVVGSVAAPPVTGGPTTPGWTAAPLVLVAAGCCWILLESSAVWNSGSRGRSALVVHSRPLGALSPRLAAPIVALAALTVAGTLAAAGGSLRAERTVDPELAAELDAPGRLLAGVGTAHPRLVDGAHPRFGTDDLAPSKSTANWMRSVDGALVAERPERVRDAVASAATHSVRHISLVDPEPALQHAGDLVEPRGELPNGQTVLRVAISTSPVRLLGPDLSRESRIVEAPSPAARPIDVDANLGNGLSPHLTLRVSDGGPGRQLVLGVVNEPGWWARVDGAPAPLADVWGDQLAVPLPTQAAEVEVGYSDGARVGLLIGQAVVILFTLVGALPERRRGTRGRRRATAHPALK